MIVSIFLAQTHDIFILDGLQPSFANIKELLQTLSTNHSRFVIFVDNKCIASSDIVSIEWLFNIDLIFIRSSCIETKISNYYFLVLWMLIGDHLESVAIFLGSLIKLGGVSIDLFELTNCPKFLFLFSFFDWVLFFLVFVFRLRLHK